MGQHRNLRSIRAFERAMKRYVLPTVLLALTVNLAVAMAAKPPKGGDLSIAAKPNPLVLGRTAALSGKLKGANHAGQNIQVQADPFPYSDNGFATVATPTTAANGDWAASNK